MWVAQRGWPLHGPHTPTGPSEAGSGAPSWSTEDKPLSSEQLEPTYRKGSECWSEGTGRGSSRVFLGTPRLKFVLETEEKTRELLWADVKWLCSPAYNSGAPEDQAQPWKLPLPPSPVFSTSPELLPSSPCTHRPALSQPLFHTLWAGHTLTQGWSPGNLIVSASWTPPSPLQIKDKNGVEQGACLHCGSSFSTLLCRTQDLALVTNSLSSKVGILFTNCFPCPPDAPGVCEHEMCTGQPASALSALQFLTALSRGYCSRSRREWPRPWEHSNMWLMSTGSNGFLV